MTERVKTLDAARKPASTSARPRGRRGDDVGARVPHVSHVKEFIRALAVAEKHYHLYPIEGKVVQQSLERVTELLGACHRAVSSDVVLEVGQYDLTFEGETVYHDAARAQSLANRLYRDSVRRVIFRAPGSKSEIAALLTCFKTLRFAGEIDADFGTLFWEKDCTHIEIETADDFVQEDELPGFFSIASVDDALSVERFELSEGEEQRLQANLPGGLGDSSEGDSTFEFTEQDLEKVEQLMSDEDGYCPLYDFVDILLELLIQDADPDGSTFARKILRPAIVSAVESRDFFHASGLLKKLTEDRNGMTSAHQFFLRDVLRSFCESETFAIVEEYLAECGPLSEKHAVFEFMKLLGREAAPRWCECLALKHQAPGVIEVLCQLKTGTSSLFSQYLLNPDPLIAKGVVQVILKSDPDGGPVRIAAALKNPSEAVRVYVAKILLERGERRSGPAFLPLLRETSGQMVHLATKYFASVPCPEAAQELLAFVKSKRFQEMDAVRKESGYRALVAADSKRGVELVSRIVHERSLFGGKGKLQRKTAALRSLAADSSGRSRPILEKFARKDGHPLCTPARQVLRSLRKPGVKAEVRSG